MLSVCTTVCRPLTAQIDDHTPIRISVFLIFHLPRDHMYRGLKIIIIIIIIIPASAGVPVSKEPVGLLRSDGKRSDQTVSLLSLGKAANLCAGM